MAKKVKLIDAGKLKEALGDWIIDARYEHDIIATIDDQPEVKVIPTEWIERWLGEKIVDDRLTSLDFEAVEFIAEEMIQEWEKQNETDRRR